MQVRALPPVAVALIALVGLILIIMGLPGFYVRQASHSVGADTSS